MSSSNQRVLATHVPFLRHFRILPALAGALLVLTSACRQNSDDIVIGMAAPIERVYGKTAEQGARLAVDAINRGGGINGRRIELRVKDDRTDGPTAIAIAGEFLSDPEVLAVLGHVNSGTTREAAQMYGRGLVALSPTATSPEIAQLNSWIFRVSGSDEASAASLAQVARQLGRRISVIYLNDDYGRSLARSFADALARSGAPPIRMDPYLEDLEDFTPFLERLRRSGVDLIFFAGLEDGAATAIRQARQMGMEARFMGGDGIEALVFMGPDYDGTLIATLYHPDASPAAREFAERFRAVYGSDPDSPAALSYDGINLLAEALRAGKLTRASIRDYLAQVGRPGGLPPFQGIGGTVRFDEYGDPVDKEFAITVVSDGTLTLFNGAH
jgi:branched-chain amino acid transport system substrate-binding protein